MRKLYYILFLSVIFWNCDDNVGYPFSGKDAVYFQLETEDFYWTRTLDSMVYSFAGKGVDEDTLWVRVNLEGNTSSEFRPFIIVVDEAETTAEVNLHYEALKSEYDLPKDSVYVYVPIIVYNKDRRLDNEPVIITLKLQPTEALALNLLLHSQYQRKTNQKQIKSSNYSTFNSKEQNLAGNKKTYTFVAVTIQTKTLWQEKKLQENQKNPSNYVLRSLQMATKAFIWIFTGMASDNMSF